MVTRRRTAAERPDRRVKRTRKALLQAFVSLFFERAYDDIRVADVVARADVGRSTFYEHFSDKDELLAESSRGPLGALAAAVDVEADLGGLRRTLEHFRQNANQVRRIFAGAPRKAVVRILAEMIEARLAARSRRGPSATRLAAIALAEGQVGSIAAWLTGEPACTASEAAAMMRDLARACAAAVGRSG